MKKSRFAPLAILCLSLALSVSLHAQAVDDVGEQYFRGFVMKNDAEKLEGEGNFAGALQMYQTMGQIFDDLAKTHPEWQPGMVNNRRTLTQQSITRLQAKLAQPASAPAPAATSPAPAAATLPIFNPAATAPAPGTVAPIAGTGGGLPSLSETLAQWEQAYRQRMLQLETQNNQMQLDLGKWQQWYQWASGEIATARAEKESLEKRTADLEKSIATMKEEVAAGRAAASQLDALVKEKLSIEVEYRKASQRLIAAEQAAKDSSQKLSDAALRISSLETERNKLLTERDAAMKERDAALAGKNLATEERDKLSVQNLGMKAEIESLKKRAPASDEVKRILAENERLKKDLEVAQKQVETLKSDVSRKDIEIANLRGQVTTLQGEITTLRQQSATFQTQVAELTLQLKNLLNGKPEAMTPELAKENELLREIIMRQLRTQYRQQQAKDLVIGELKKMEGVSQTLLEQVQDLKDSRITLTPEEEKLFSDPSVREMLGSNSIQGTLIAQISKPTEDKPTTPTSPLDALLNKANGAFSAQKFAEAATLFEDALRADPKNTTALVGLGYSRQRENKLTEAEAALKKCLTFDPNNETAAFHLGVTHFKQERWNDATAAFEKGLQKNAQNARARHYLGIISTKLNFLDRAEREFKTAIAIDPNYGEAHFNLAVLYATWDPPQWDKAKAEYDEALKKGVTPDSALEKLLKGNTTKSVSTR